MISSRRPVVLANEIKLKRQQHTGCFLLVEGRDDRLFLESFISQETCKVMVMQGKQNVLDVIQILNAESFRGVIGIVDADFDRVVGSLSVSQNVLSYDNHDLETMLICWSALERVLVEFGSKGKLERFGQDIQDALLARALPLGYLRLHSLQAGLDLTFTGLRYSKWISPSSFLGCTSKLLHEIKNRSRHHNLPVASIESAIDSLSSAGHHPREVCVGVDLVEILSIGLRSVLGSKRASEVNGEALRTALRLSYPEQEFLASGLGQSLQVWESKMSGQYQVLRQ